MGRSYAAAYRDQHGAIQTVGMCDSRLAVIKDLVQHASQDDPSTRFFVVELVTEWRELA